VEDVWRWYALEHVRNHPRWDPDMQLEQISEGPMGLGTKIRRRNVRWGTPVEGEMEVVEFESERAFALSIHDSNMEMFGRATFEVQGTDRTMLKVSTDIPEMDESADANFLTTMMERSLGNVKTMVESETGA
jgi:hypothetical protein